MAKIKNIHMISILFPSRTHAALNTIIITSLTALHNRYIPL
jgi:hypothetical protein